MSAARQLRPPDWLSQISEPIVALSGSSDASRYAVLGSEGKAVILDAATGQSLRDWSAHSGGGFRLAWHPTQNLLATSGGDGFARLWDPSTGTLLREISGGSAWVEQLEWSPDGQYLAIGAGRSLTVCQAGDEIVHTWKNHQSTVAAVCWRHDGKKLAAACYGGVSVYHPDTGQMEERLPWKTSLLSLAWSPDCRWVVAGTQDLSVQIWPQPFKLGDELAMSGYEGKVRELAWHHSSRYLATGGGVEIMVWDCAGAGPSGTSPRILSGHTAKLSALAYQARGHLLASADGDGGLRVWNVKQPQALLEVRLPSAVTALAWSRNDQSLLVGTHDGSVALVKAPQP